MKNRECVVALLAAAILSLLTSCKATELTSVNDPPIIKSVIIMPTNPETGQTLTANVNVSDRESDPLVLAYEWYVDGKKVEVTGESLPSDYVNPGGSIYFKVQATENRPQGKNKSSEWKQSNTVKIGEEKIQVGGVSIEPTEAYVDSVLEAVVDWGGLEPNSVSVYYQWVVNGQTVNDSFGPNLDRDHFQHGDAIQVAVNANNDFEDKSTRRSRVVKINNSRPEIISNGEFNTSGGVVSIQVEARDKDGDDLTYFLDQAPQGATINQNTGEITWEAPKGFKGSVKFTYGVDDGNGGKYLQSASVNLQRPEDQVEERRVLKEEKPATEEGQEQGTGEEQAPAQKPAEGY